MKDKTKELNSNRLLDNQRKKMDGLAKESKMLEKEINRLIKDFEKKHKLNCWVTHHSPGKICVEIAIDKDNL